LDIFWWWELWLRQFKVFKCSLACQTLSRTNTTSHSALFRRVWKCFAVVVALSSVFPLAEEMPFTRTLKIIKHIMDITVTLWLVCSFVGPGTFCMETLLNGNKPASYKLISPFREWCVCVCVRACACVFVCVFKFSCHMHKYSEMPFLQTQNPSKQ
jgi:hypothetical protein